MKELERIAPGTATRTHDGIREEVGFFGGPDRLFGVTYRPQDPSVGVVICSPIHAELLRNYHREVILARSLARAGYAVQRFQYRGSGNSDGAPSEETFESLLEDVETAAARLVETTGVDRLVFVGTRLGAVLAAIVGATRGGVALAMWEPVLNADRYFREIFRGHLVSGLKKSEDGQERKPQEELRDTGSVDVLGYSIDRPLVESVQARRLLDDVAVVPAHVLVVQIGGARGLRAELGSLVDRWEKAGVSVQTHQLEGTEPWWFGGTPQISEDDRDRANELEEVTTQWMLTSVPPRA
jgi:pimeloyl-ACP methyl ester carboxylesterase